MLCLDICSFHFKHVFVVFVFYFSTKKKNKKTKNNNNNNNNFGEKMQEFYFLGMLDIACIFA
jgi:hypothetical protein